MTDSIKNRLDGGISQLVECPRCGHEFELSETFRAHFEAEKRREIDIALRDNEAKIRAEAEEAKETALAESAEQVKTLEAQLKADKRAQDTREKQIRADAEQAKQAALAESAEQVKTLEAQLKADKQAQDTREKQIRADAEKAKQEAIAQSAEQVKTLEAQLKADKQAQDTREKQIRAEAEQAKQAAVAQSAEQVKTLEAQLKADKQAQDTREKQIRADAEQARQTELSEIRAEFELDRKEREIAKQRIEKQVADLQKQLGQGSVELQGEALEVYLKNQLQATFPIDQIDDIQRGRFGADLTQEVLDEQFQNCGILVWEAKRTKHWNDQWLAKIKDDADRVGAHLRIIVSEALPPDIRIFDLREGVWVSSLQGALPLARALRSQLIESARLQRAGQGKGLKMDAIYQYLTSPRFSERIQRMADTWKALKEQVDTEERAMQRQWKARRKQLDRMQDATLEMYTDFEAILGREIPQVPGLELEALPPSDDVEEHTNEIIKLPSATKD